MIELMDETSELLSDEGLKPGSGRDYSNRKFQIDQLVERFERLLPLFAELVPQVDAGSGKNGTEAVVQLGLGVFAVLHASGDSGRALVLLAKVTDIARSSDLADLALAAGDETASFIELAACRHDILNGRDARPALNKIAKNARLPAIKKMAAKWMHSPQPITAAPTLWTINGFGTGLYGSRDRDGNSEVKTLCLSALFIPLFPLKAYRVIDHGEGSYGFINKQRLSAFARIYQKLLLVSVVALIGWCNVDSYLNSPGRLAAKELAAAESLEKAGNTAEAERQYERLIDHYASSGNADTISAAGLGLVRLSTAKVAEPFTLEHIDHALRVVKRFEGLPHRARGESVAVHLVAKLTGWQASLGSETEPAIAGGVTLLESAMRIASPEQRGEIDAAANALKTTLAERLTRTRPLAALDLLMELGASDAAGDLLAKIAESPSLLVAAEGQAMGWLRSVPASDLAERINGALESARAQRDDADRVAAVETRDARALAAAAARFPKDHQVAAGLAELDLAGGAPKAAIDRLLAQGEPGWLIPSVQELLASAYGDVGQLDTADAILTELLAYRLPVFRRAASAYYGAAKRLREQLMSRVDTGSAPGNVMAAVRGDDEGAAIAAFEEWSATEMDGDAELAQRKATYQAYVDVVPSSLSLGMLKLRRANQASGAEREALLGGAETVFLSIRDDAEGVPSYHLGLGQVYHRLGKTAEGDGEFNGLLVRNDPTLSLQVSGAYRELGLVARAAEVAENVWSSGADKDRESAAHMMSFIVDDLDDKQMWLERSNQKLPEVQTSLLQVRANRAARDGEDAEAEKLYRQVAAFYERNSRHNAVSANNGAIANLQLYDVTGDRRSLKKARDGFEASLRLEPQDALVVANLASHCNFEGWLEVLGAWLPVDAVRFDRSDVGVLKDALAAGPERESLLARAASNRILRRSIELGEQERALAPGFASGWERELQRLALLRDAAGLRRLEEQVGRAKVDTAELEKRRAEWVSGEGDAEHTAHLDREIARLEKRLASALKTRSKAAIGAAHYLLGRTQLSRGTVTRDTASLRAALEHLRTAVESWPDLVVEPRLVEAMLRTALLETSTPVVAEQVNSSWKRVSATSLIAIALAGENGEAFRGAAAASPLIGEAARLLSGSKRARPSLSMWVVGKLAGNSELERRGAGVFDLEDELVEAKIDAMLNPGAESERAYLGLLVGRGKITAEE